MAIIAEHNDTNNGKESLVSIVGPGGQRLTSEHEARRHGLLWAQRFREANENARANVDPDYAYQLAEKRAALEDGREQRLERLRTREGLSKAAGTGGSEPESLSTPHSCPQPAETAEKTVSEALLADLREQFGDDIRIEVVTEQVGNREAKRKVTRPAVRVYAEEPDIGAVGNTSLSELNASAHFAHGGSVAKASRDRTRQEGGPAHGGGPRGVIDGFSYASRRRLMRFLGELERTARPYFVTLTYPDDFPTDPETWKDDLHKFRRRLERRVSNVAAVWRLELERRKSGENRGRLAPHFHLLIYNVLDFDLAAFVEDHWHDLAGNGSDDHRWVHSKERGKAVTLMQSWRHCSAYAAKELAKTAQAAIETFSLEVDEPAVGKVSVVSNRTGETVYVCESNEAAREFIEAFAQYPDGVGRFWGAWGRERLPWTARVAVWVADRVSTKMIRYMRKHAGIDRAFSTWQSLTVMCDVAQWLRLFSRLLENPPDVDAHSMRYVDSETGELGAFIGPVGGLP